MTVSKIVLLMSWVSKFVLFWLMILRVIPRNDFFVWAMLFVFFVMSLLTSASATAREKKVVEVE